MICRRSFLRTLGAAIAAGFAKVETRLIERPGGGLLALIDDGPVALTYNGIPFYMNDGVTSGVWMGINRDCFRLDPYVDVNAPFPPRAFEDRR